MNDAIETMNITVDAPEAGWSGIRFGKEAFIPLSYVQNIPEDIIDAAKAWMAGEDVNLFCDGEGISAPMEKEELTDGTPTPARALFLKLSARETGEEGSGTKKKRERKRKMIKRKRKLKKKKK